MSIARRVANKFVVARVTPKPLSFRVRCLLWHCWHYGTVMERWKDELKATTKARRFFFCLFFFVFFFIYIYIKPKPQKGNANSCYNIQKLNYMMANIWRYLSHRKRWFFEYQMESFQMVRYLCISFFRWIFRLFRMGYLSCGWFLKVSMARNSQMGKYDFIVISLLILQTFVHLLTFSILNLHCHEIDNHHGETHHSL